MKQGAQAIERREEGEEEYEEDEEDVSAWGDATLAEKQRELELEAMKGLHLGTSNQHQDALLARVRAMGRRNPLHPSIRHATRRDAQGCSWFHCSINQPVCPGGQQRGGGSGEGFDGGCAGAWR